MTTLREAAQQALEALETAVLPTPRAFHAAADLRAALEQPEPCDIAEDGVCETLDCQRCGKRLGDGIHTCTPRHVIESALKGDGP